MLYTKSSFTAPATGTANPKLCEEKGHSAKDSRGRCMCCGEKIGPSMTDTVESFRTLKGKP